MQQMHSIDLGRIISVKQYTVEITNEALADMEQLYNHIANVLLAPENAIGQYDRIADAILTLDTCFRYRKQIERLMLGAQSKNPHL